MLCLTFKWINTHGECSSAKKKKSTKDWEWSWDGSVIQRIYLSLTWMSLWRIVLMGEKKPYIKNYITYVMKSLVLYYKMENKTMQVCTGFIQSIVPHSSSFLTHHLTLPHLDKPTLKIFCLFWSASCLSLNTICICGYMLMV